MAISRSHASKAPSQDPTSFYKGVQQGGSQGSPSKVPEKLTGGPMLEKIMGRPELGRKAGK